jgi:hypothetical protein
MTATEPASEHEHRRFDRRTAIPIAALAVLVIAPVAIWAATSGGSDTSLRVDQGVSASGGPEIVVNVPKKLNNTDETKGATTVMLICDDAGGKAVLQRKQGWPFINEPGYPWPHIHQAVTPAQLQEIARCRLDGTKTKLEGNLRRT